MQIDLILPYFTPSMCGECASVFIKEIPVEVARSLVSGRTQILARDLYHLKSARHLFPHANEMTIRFAELRPGMTSIFLKYSGPSMREGEPVPASATFKTYLIEVEAYQEAA